jgi:hypothetical protein
MNKFVVHDLSALFWSSSWYLRFYVSKILDLSVGEFEVLIFDRLFKILSSQY